jgi:cyclic beta-1,2-glucan synthetase
MDPYAAAVSDVYQDLFGEGSYTGKGSYDVDAARAGLASDVEVIEEVPIIAKLS